ncbi:MAG: hypothetical protein C0183_20260 [Roseiflexus castenholzii]|nr:MAG: hypothetical protein C0183_20260 [Roseiflexus castenholzii]
MAHGSPRIGTDAHGSEEPIRANPSHPRPIGGAHGSPRIGTDAHGSEEPIRANPSHPRPIGGAHGSPRIETDAYGSEEPIRANPCPIHLAHPSPARGIMLAINSKKRGGQ